MIAALLEQRQRGARQSFDLVDRRVRRRIPGGSRRPRHGRRPRRRHRLPRGRVRPQPPRSPRPSAELGADTRSRGRVRVRPRASVGRVRVSARSSRLTAARQSPRQRARRPATASRSPARSVSAGRGGRVRPGSGRPVRGGSREARPARSCAGVRAFEPVGEALVQLDADGFRESRRRRRPGSADGGSGRHLRRGSARGEARSAPCARAQSAAAVMCCSPSQSACTALWWKTRPATAASLEDATFGRVELVEPGGQERLDRRRHRHLRAA